MANPQIQGLPEGVTLKPIAGLPEGVELRSIGNTQDQPTGNIRTPSGAPAEGDTRNAFQRWADNMSTPDPRREEWQTPAQQAVAHGAQQLVSTPLSMLAHPLQTAKGMVKLVGDIGQSPYYGIGENMVKPLITNYMQDTSSHGPGYALSGLGGNVTGQVATGEITGAALKPVLGLPRAMSNYVNPKSSPNIVPPIEVHAENLAKAIRPAGGINPNTLKSIQAEAPAVREYAQRTGNPLQTRPEGFKAAEGVAQEGVKHYNDNIYEPNKDVQVQLSSGESPTLGHVTTIEGIEGRIGQINDRLRATPGKSEGATMTAIERTGMENEVKALRQRLYTTLSEKTGIPADQIRDLRQGYGGEYTIANSLQSGRMGTLDRAAAESQSFSASPTKSGLIASFVHRLPGLSEEAIGNRQFRSAMRKFEPQAPTRPIPNPPAAQPYTSTPMAHDLAARIQASGAGVGELPPRYAEPPAAPPNPLPNVNAVPELKAASDVARKLRAEENAKYQAAKRRQQLRSSTAKGSTSGGHTSTWPNE